MNNPDAPVTKEEFMRIHNIGQPADLAAVVEVSGEGDGEEEFDHGGCFMPHVRNGEYIDCDGRPL